MCNDSRQNSERRPTSIIAQMLDATMRFGLYTPHKQLVDIYVRRWSTCNSHLNGTNSAVQRAVLFDLRILVYENCISCTFLTPIIQYAQEHGYIKQIEVITFDNKQHYKSTIAGIAAKHHQPPYYPLVLVQYEGGEVMMPAHIVIEILDLSRNEIDEQIFLEIISGDATPDTLKAVLTPLTSKFILGMYEAIQMGNAA